MGRPPKPPDLELLRDLPGALAQFARALDHFAGELHFMTVAGVACVAVAAAVWLFTRSRP